MVERAYLVEMSYSEKAMEIPEDQMVCADLCFKKECCYKENCNGHKECDGFQLKQLSE